MDRKLLIILVFIAVVTAGQNFFILDGLNSGKFMAVLRPQLILSADCPWEDMPPAIKEYISLNATVDTKLDKKDMLQLAAYYQNLAVNYKESIVLRDRKDYPKKATKEKEAVK